MGSIIDVDELWAMNTIVSPSSTKPLKNIKAEKQSSSLLFEPNAVVNEILTSLRYFSQKVTGTSGEKGASKDAYSWGEVMLIYHH